MKLNILPENKVREVQQGDNLMDAVRKAGINLASSCGGAGTCGKCKVELISGNLESKARTKKLGANEVLSCQSFITDQDVTVNIPNDGRRLSSHKVLINEASLPNPFALDPLFRKVVLTLPEPGIDNNIDDLSRILVELRRQIGIEDIYFSLPMMQKLPLVLREGGWTVTVGLAMLSCSAEGCRTEVISLEPGEVKGPYYGLAELQKAVLTSINTRGISALPRSCTVGWRYHEPGRLYL